MTSKFTATNECVKILTIPRGQMIFDVRRDAFGFHSTLVITLVIQLNTTNVFLFTRHRIASPEKSIGAPVRLSGVRLLA